MDDHHLNKIEQQLRAMRPSEPDPEVKQRIAASLEEEPVETGRSLQSWYARPMVVLAAALIAIACLILLQPPGHDPASVVEVPDSGMPDMTEQRVVIRNLPPARGPAPTLSELMQAWCHSPEALDQALDRPVFNAPPQHEAKPEYYTPADARRWPAGDPL